MIDIQWDHNFEVGHTRIDHEHQVFVDLIRAVSLEAKNEQSLVRMGRLLKEVQKYAEFHFVSEENIMLDASFPEFENHRKEHSTLLAQLDQKIFAVRAGQITLDAVADFMFQWFALHTTREDKKIGLYLASAK